jgi:hypothetical protein
LAASIEAFKKLLPVKIYAGEATIMAENMGALRQGPMFSMMRPSLGQKQPEKIQSPLSFHFVLEKWL